MMNLQSTDILWLIVALTSPWYYTSTLVLILNAPSAAPCLSAVWKAACAMPVAPSFARIHHHICPQQRSTLPPFSDSTEIQNTIVSATYFVDGLPTGLVSVDDAVFLAKSNPINCRSELIRDFHALKQGSQMVVEDLEELRAYLMSLVDMWVII